MGRYQLKTGEIANLLPQDGRFAVRARRIERIYRIAAGLVQLGDLADRLTKAIAEAVYHYIPDLKQGDNRVLEKHEYAIKLRTRGNLGIRRDWAIIWVDDLVGDQQTLRIQPADDLFKKTEIDIYGMHGNDGARGSFRRDRSRPQINGVVEINLASIVYAALSEGKKFESVLHSTIAHELRHAADYAYHRAGNADWEKQRISPLHDLHDLHDEDWSRKDYLNRPTELRSWAGNVAQDLVDRYGAHEDLYSWESFKSSLFSTGMDEVLGLVLPENRKRFLQMVYSEMVKLLGYQKKTLDVGMNVLRSQAERISKDMWREVMTSGKDYKNYTDILFGDSYGINRWDAKVTSHWRLFEVFNNTTKNVFLKMLGDRFRELFLKQYEKDNPEMFKWKQEEFAN